MIGTRYKAVIELFDEKTGETVRSLRFRSPNEFNEFLTGFKAMRYPGFCWRYKEKDQKKDNKEE